MFLVSGGSNDLTLGSCTVWGAVSPGYGFLLLARLESAYSLILGSHQIWGKGGGDTLALL